jgi:hypothetical protein
VRRPILRNHELTLAATGNASLPRMGLVPRRGLEPPTYRLGICCSVQMSYWGLLKKGGIMATTMCSVNPIYGGKDERWEDLKPRETRGKPEMGLLQPLNREPLNL